MSLFSWARKPRRYYDQGPAGLGLDVPLTLHLAFGLAGELHVDDT